MKARGRAASLAFPAVPALMAAAVLAVGVPMVRLAAWCGPAPGGGAPWQVALQAAAAVGAVTAGAALAAHRTTALCGTLLMLAGPAVVIAAVPVAAPARPALLFTIALAGPALAPALLGSAALTCPAGRLSNWDRLAVAVSLVVAGLVCGTTAGHAVRLEGQRVLHVRGQPGGGARRARPAGQPDPLGPGPHHRHRDGHGRPGHAAMAAGTADRAAAERPVAVGGAAVALLSAVAAGYALAQPVPVIDAQSRAIWLAQCAIVVLMAGGVAATGLRTRRLASQIAAQVLAATPDAATAAGTRWPQSIDDPGLALVFPRDDGTVVDASAGQPARRRRRWPSPRCAGPAGRSQRSGTGLSWPGAGQLLGTAVRQRGPCAGARRGSGPAAGRAGRPGRIAPADHRGWGRRTAAPGT